MCFLYGVSIYLVISKQRGTVIQSCSKALLEDISIFLMSFEKLLSSTELSPNIVILFLLRYIPYYFSLPILIRRGMKPTCKVSFHMRNLLYCCVLIVSTLYTIFIFLQ